MGELSFVPMRASTALAFLALVSFAYCASCDGKPNLNPISVDAPVLVNTTQYGKYFIQNSVSPPLAVVHVYGTPYQMGYAQGELMKDQMNKLIPEIFEWMTEEIEETLSFLPEWMQKMIGEKGLPYLLDKTWEWTKPYTPQHFVEEMQGLADGSGLTMQQIIQLHMIPELVKAHCSMVGAWGASISNTTGTLYQLRALDWSTNGPFQQFPQVTVYHPNDGNGHEFSILTWSTFIIGCVCVKNN